MTSDELIAEYDLKQLLRPDEKIIWCEPVSFSQRVFFSRTGQILLGVIAVSIGLMIYFIVHCILTGHPSNIGALAGGGGAGGGHGLRKTKSSNVGATFAITDQGALTLKPSRRVEWFLPFSHQPVPIRIRGRSVVIGGKMPHGETMPDGTTPKIVLYGLKDAVSVYESAVAAQQRAIAERSRLSA